MGLLYYVVGFIFFDEREGQGKRDGDASRFRREALLSVLLRNARKGENRRRDRVWVWDSKARLLEEERRKKGRRKDKGRASETKLRRVHGT